MISTITVVLLTCNRTAFVRKALDGLLQQADADWTLTASDCSDEPAAREELHRILEDFRRNNPAHETRIIQQPKRIPQGEHLRLALQSVDTTYVALLDDDDIWMP